MSEKVYDKTREKIAFALRSRVIAYGYTGIFSLIAIALLFIGVALMYAHLLGLGLSLMAAGFTLIELAYRSFNPEKFVEECDERAELLYGEESR